MKKNTRVVDDADESGLEIDLSLKPSRKFGGDDADPVDLDTGEEIFADITPRLRDVQAESEEPEEEPEDEDEDDLDDPKSDEEDLADEEVDAAEDEEDDLDEVDSDAEAARARSKKSGKWTRRLEREKRLRLEEKEENRELRERLDKIEASTALQANTDTFNKTKAKLEAQITALNTELETAVEEGDTKAQVRLQGELLDLKVDLKTETVKFETAKTQVAEASTGTTAKSIIRRKADQWARKHPKFERDPVFAQFVRAVDNAMAAEGHDARTDEYYKELDKRVKERYPEEYPRSAKTPDIRTKKRRHPSVMQSRESDRSAAPAAGKNGFRVRGNKISLTAAQVQTMRTFQLDPTNPKDVREFYVNNK